MTGTVVPGAPALAHRHGVELMQTGQWDSISGTHTFTTADLSSAVAALDCPAVRRPVLKLGHDGHHGVGEPAVGWVDNVATTDDGRTLTGDFVGMPGWFGQAGTDTDVLGSAWPDRSIEGTYDFRCQLGHQHPFVVEAVALLGVEAPAIGTLNSLAGAAALYGVELGDTAAGRGESIVLTHRVTEAPMTTTTVNASVSTEDVRRAYYETADWSLWITEMNLDPLELIVVDDWSGDLFRVPVTASGDGTEGVTFGDAVQVVVRYEDVAPVSGEPAPVAASRARRDGRVVFASRAESRPNAGPDPRGSRSPAASADGSTIAASAAEGSSTVEFTTEQVSALAAALGLDPVPTDAQTIVDAVVAALSEQPAAATAAEAAAAEATKNSAAVAAGKPVAASSALPDGVVAIEKDTLDQLRSSAQMGVDARNAQLDTERLAIVDAAVKDGRISVGRRGAWLSKIAGSDSEGAAAELAALEHGLVPVSEIGHAGEGVDLATTTDVRETPAYKNWSI